MAAGSRIVLLAGALVFLAALAIGWHWDGTGKGGIGMTAVPCAEDGSPAAGELADDWARLCTYQKANAELAKTGARPAIVMIGDSITAFWPSRDKPVVNRGIAGQTSAQVLLRFQQDAIALKPQAIHILVGTNDIAGNAGPASPEMFRNNIRAMVDAAKANGISVILGTIPPARAFDWNPSVDPGKWVPTLNGWLAQYAREEEIVLADYYAVLAESDGSVREDSFWDGIHPKRKGYTAMDRVLMDAVEGAGMADKLSDPQPAGSGI